MKNKVEKQNRVMPDFEWGCVKMAPIVQILCPVFCTGIYPSESACIGINARSRHCGWHLIKRTGERRE
jgi:hypothetical protein